MAKNLTPIPNTGNDTVSVTHAGSYTADLGNGNDSFYDEYPSNITVSGGTGNDTVGAYYGVNASVDLGSGNDFFTANTAPIVLFWVVMGTTPSTRNTAGAPRSLAAMATITFPLSTASMLPLPAAAAPIQSTHTMAVII